MKFSLFTDYGALNSKEVFDAFASGITNCGHTYSYNEYDCDVPVIWSVLWHGRMAGNKKVWDYFKAQNKQVLVLEVGGLKRGTTWKVGIDGINKEAYFGPDGNDDTRAKELGLTLKPWQENNNGDILICAQHNKSHQLRSVLQTNLILDTLEHIRNQTDRRIIVRPHPRCPLTGMEHEFPNVVIQRPVHVKGTYDDFDLNLSNVFMLYSYSSNPGLQAVMEGIPVAVSESSLAYPVANEWFCNLNDIKRPDRTQWLNDLAYTEWTLDEIRAGIPLNRLTYFF
tara:strand:- start:10619 stop:11464 length:846 start_codon:yes stop_codon:yes gene_type:complete